MFNLPTGDYRFTLKLYSPDNDGGTITLLCNNEGINVSYNKSNAVQTIVIEVTNKSVTGFRISVWSSLKSVYLDEFKITAQ